MVQICGMVHWSSLLVENHEGTIEINPEAEVEGSKWH